MFVSIYYKPNLFNAQTMILIVHIFMNVKLTMFKQNRKCTHQCDETQSDPSCLLSSLLPSSFVVYLSSCTRRRHFFVERACVLVFHCIGEYITLDLFYLVNLASICSLSPKKYMF